jgi:hypothetical protein
LKDDIILLPLQPQNYFPTKVGSEWVYIVTNGVDSIERSVLVIDSLRWISGTYFRWVVQDSTSTDTFYITTYKDTIKKYFDLNNHWPPQIEYILPIHIDGVWQWSFPCGTGKVLHRDTVAVQAGVFHNIYQIQYEWDCYNDHTIEVRWVDPEIGVIKISKKGLRTEENWELKRYTIPGI